MKTLIGISLYNYDLLAKYLMLPNDLFGTNNWPNDLFGTNEDMSHIGISYWWDANELIPP